jgi:hypothetical protein
MGSDPVNSIDTSGGVSLPFQSFTFAQTALSGTFTAATKTVSTFSVVSSGISIAIKGAVTASNIINTSTNTQSVGSQVSSNVGNNPNCCGGGDPVQNIIQFGKDFYKDGILPGLNWINHNANPTYLVWNAYYSNRTGRDFLDQTPINKTQTKVDAVISIIPFLRIEG